MTTADGDDLVGLTPERVDSDNDDAIPFNTRYAMSARLKLTRSGRRSQCSTARASVTWSYSDGVGTPNELQR